MITAIVTLVERTVKPVHNSTLRIVVSCLQRPVLICPVKIGKVVSDTLNKGHLSTKATFVIPRG